jgi:hypothetical protein
MSTATRDLTLLQVSHAHGNEVPEEWSRPQHEWHCDSTICTRQPTAEVAAVQPRELEKFNVTFSLLWRQALVDVIKFMLRIYFVKVNEMP